MYLLYCSVITIFPGFTLESED